jgi:hypothetical protein
MVPGFRGVFPVGMEKHPSTKPSEPDVADVTALADGSLPADRRPDVERRVAASPALRELLRAQTTSVGAVRRAAGPAPAGLRARIETERRRASGPAPLLPRRVAVAAAFAVAVVAAVVLIALPSGSPRSPTVAQAAALSGRDASAPPPRRYDGLPLLDREVDGLHFPRWQDRFRWRASGVRVDRLGGRRATTVFYDRAGKRIGYTIVAGRALRLPAGRSSRRNGVGLRSLRSGDRIVVTWRRKGRTCVLSGTGVRDRELLALAAWRAGGRLAY